MEYNGLFWITLEIIPSNGLRNVPKPSKLVATAKHFFLFGLDGKHKIGMSLFIFGLYTMHNEIRHHPDKTDFKKCFMRVCGEVHLRPCLQSVWNEIFGWSPRQAPRQRWQFVLATPKCHPDSVAGYIFQIPTSSHSNIISSSNQQLVGDSEMPTLDNCHAAGWTPFYCNRHMHSKPR